MIKGISPQWNVVYMILAGTSFSKLTCLVKYHFYKMVVLNFFPTKSVVLLYTPNGRSNQLQQIPVPNETWESNNRYVSHHSYRSLSGISFEYWASQYKICHYEFSADHYEVYNFRPIVFFIKNLL